MKQPISKLHFISNQTEQFTHLQSIELALETGCRCVQLRVKNMPDDEILSLAYQARKLCDDFEAALIINDYPHIAKAAGADGLHLGLDDMSVMEAKKIVGRNMVIGGTANTWEHISQRVAEEVDYIGLGPLRFTSTKQNLSPVLGFEGYATIKEKMKAHGYVIPLIAIGGIVKSDIPVLYNFGLYGVAISSSLSQAENPKEFTSFIHNTLC